MVEVGSGLCVVRGREHNHRISCQTSGTEGKPALFRHTSPAESRLMISTINDMCQFKSTLQVIHPKATGVNLALVSFCGGGHTRFHFWFTGPRPLFRLSLVLRRGPLVHILGNLLPWH